MRLIHAGCVEEAISSVALYFEEGGVVRDLEQSCEAIALEDRATRPIVVGHLIKMCRAAFQESEALGNTPERAHPVLAFVRLAASPIRERSVARLAHEAIGFVEHSRVPKTLT